METEGTIFDVREFCLHDGPGVRTTVFLKGCPLRCVWCHNPEGWSAAPELLLNRQACTACGACRRRCRHAERCRACGECAPVCPQGCRRLCGRRVSAESLAAELRRHERFFTDYGGGVTFSGGEPLAQAAFVEAVAGLLRPLHLALETSGYSAPADYRRAAGAVDLVIQDLKHPDPEEHRRYTGVALAPILANLEWLKASGRPFIARIPLIPGVNDAPETLSAAADLLQGESGLIAVELLPYHRTAGAKYALLGLSYTPPFDPSGVVRPDTAVFTSRGWRCHVL